MINWVYFPKSSPPPNFGLLIVALFEEAADSIDSNTTVNQHCDTVLFGRKGKILKCFNADAHAASEGWALEVEAGRAVDNNQFLKDIFQACMMYDLHLEIARCMSAVGFSSR
jgi:hypothetical protein